MKEHLQVHTEKIGQTTIRISYAEYYDSPREYGMSKMFCFNKKYELGDKHNYKVSDFNNWIEMREQISNEFDVHTILPLYLYDHSGITMSTTPFNCQWDSGQVGWIFISNKDVKSFGIKDVQEFLEAEVEMYDKYIRGEVYQFELIQNNEVMDSCSGFFDKDECITSAREMIVELDNAEEVKQ